MKWDIIQGIRKQRDMEFHHSHPGSFTCPDKAPIHRSDILRPHPTDEATQIGHIVSMYDGVSEWLVFYVAFNNLSVISRRWLLVALDAICARVLSAANIDAPCRGHNTRLHHTATLPWHQVNQSWFYPLNAERLARKQPVPIFTPLVWCDRGSNPRPPDYEANALSARPPRRYMYQRTVLLQNGGRVLGN